MCKRFISQLLCIAILLPALLAPSYAVNSNDIYSVPTTFEHSSTVVMPDTPSIINYESPLTEDFLESLEYASPGSAVRVDSEGNISLNEKSNQVYSNTPDQTTDFGSMSSRIDTNTTIDITGEVYSKLIDAGLVDPNFFNSANGESELTPPPELIIGEGEVWIPGAIDPNLISLYGEDDECRHHGQPSNYRYIGAVYGNTDLDVLAVNLLEEVITFFVPESKFAFTLLTTIERLATILGLVDNDKLTGDYMKWQYIYNFGPDPNMYWFHTFYYTPNYELALGCEATYSPKKPGDPFQD